MINLAINVSRHSEGHFKKELVDYADADLFAFGSTLTWVDGLQTLTNNDDAFRKALDFIPNLGCDVSVEADRDGIDQHVGFVRNDDGQLALLYAIHDDGADVVYALAYLDADNGEPYVYVPRHGNNLNLHLGTINGRECDNEGTVRKVIESTLSNVGEDSDVDEQAKLVTDKLNELVGDNAVDVDVMLDEFWAKANEVEVSIDGGVAVVSSEDLKQFLASQCPDGGTWLAGVATLLDNGTFDDVCGELHVIGKRVDDGDVYLIDGHAVAVVYPFDVDVNRVAVVVYLDETMRPRAYIPRDGNVFNVDAMTPYGSEHANPEYTGGNDYVGADAPEPLVRAMLGEFSNKLLPNRSKTTSAEHFGITEVDEPGLIVDEVERPSLWYVRSFINDGVESAHGLHGPAYVVVAVRGDGPLANFKQVVVVDDGDVARAWRPAGSVDESPLPSNGVDEVLVVDHGSIVEYVLLDGEPTTVMADDGSVDGRALATLKAKRGLDDRPTYVVAVNA